MTDVIRLTLPPFKGLALPGWPQGEIARKLCALRYRETTDFDSHRVGCGRELHPLECSAFPGALLHQPLLRHAALSSHPGYLYGSRVPPSFAE